VFTEYISDIYKEDFSTLLQDNAELLFVSQQMAAGFMEINSRTTKPF
jgi:hypothetical protein